MRIAQLRYAAAVLKCGSMRQAAEELGITQPSLSQQVQRLEEDLGVRLFVRSPTGVRPTSAGEFLRPHIDALLRGERNLRQAVTALTESRAGELRIGSVPTGCRVLLPDVVSRFRERHPNIHFEVTEMGSDRVYTGIVKGEFDLGIMSRLLSEPPPEDVTVVDLFANEMVVCVPTAHPLAQAEMIGPEDLVGEPLIAHRSGFLLRKIFDQLEQRHELTAVFHTASSDTARLLVSAGVGLAFLPALAVPAEDLAQDKYRAITFDAPWASSVLAAVRRKNEQLSPPAVAIFHILRSIAADHRTTSGH